MKKDLPAAKRYLDAAAELRGPDTDLSARARLAEAQGEIDTAIQILRDTVDPDSRSTLLSIIGKARGNDAALAWFADQKLNVRDLTANGIYTVCNFHLAKEDYEGVKNILESIGESVIADSPYFLFLRGAIRFAPSLRSRPSGWRSWACSSIPGGFVL